MQYTKSVLEQFVWEHADIGKERNCLKSDCDIMEYLLEHCMITLPEENRFFVKVNCEGVMQKVIEKRAEKLHQEMGKSAYQAGMDAYAYTGMYDFGHTSAGWDDVISLGIAGLRNRLVLHSRQYPFDEEKQYFYNHAIRVYNGALRLMERAEKIAREQGKREMAEGLRHLEESAPCNLYEAMQTTIVYYTLQQMVEGSILRTLGRLDQLYNPFLKQEKDSVYVRSLAADFIREIDGFQANSNIPFVIGGTDRTGNTMYNDMSRILLKAYAEVPNGDTKLHFLYHKNTPQDMLETAFACVREGKNSICFLSDQKVEEALLRLGEDPEDAAAYTVVGCYECGGKEEITCSCNARVNIVKAVEYAMNGGRDFLTGKQIGLEIQREPETFEEFCEEVNRQLVYLCRCAMEVTDYYEREYPRLHGVPILSGTYSSAVAKGGDIYCDYAAKYNNSSVNALGLATAADSMLAVKRLVFEEKKISLQEFAELLRNDWEGQEILRMTIKNKYPKYGNGNREADSLAAGLVETLSNTINRHPNVKGGIYRLGLFSINWRHDFGRYTGASADGRKAGDALSQNTGAALGADRGGVTSHILSVTELDAGNVPNGAVLDLDLHASAVRGNAGLQMMISTLRTYFDRGGFAVHYNVLNTRVLKDAKINPENYPNLQVRLCGWNALFISLSEQEQDEFIKRAGNTEC